MNDLVPLSQTQLSVRQLDAESLIERWQEGRSPHTVRAYGRDLAHFAKWSDATTAGEAITNLLAGSMGEANERLHAYRGAMIDAGLAPSTVKPSFSASLHRPSRAHLRAGDVVS
jgi:Phage integrase, N-terminal SAM-like domain